MAQHRRPAIGDDAPPASPTDTPHWSVSVLDIFDRELADLLTDDQRDHLWDIVTDLTTESDPLACPTADIGTLKLSNGERIHVLRDRAGLLKKMELQAFFVLVQTPDDPAILFLGLWDHPHAKKLPFSLSLLLEVRLSRVQRQLHEPPASGPVVAAPGRRVTNFKE
jgi:hypothetical protein